ncbi:phosphotransferase family protein [Gallaecimonas kandeliae]|uniref:choline/ethanolamine kinase family protein n=1 Tax=Gallaecimonas kandeliae TaxID=3029055 RepID=UPI0026486F93|nr:choline/ethanolamine kinase family protein [Gallaecimonas kandeliae]WKE67156.1 phosphotransferase family protein [Gallaecimonas kandeliae]
MICNLPEPWAKARRTPFEGGLTNRHWLLEGGAGKALLRQNSAALELGIDRGAELRLWQAASAAGISPELLWQQGDWTLCRFLDAEPGPADTEQKLDALLGAIRWLQGQALALPVLPLRERALALGAGEGRAEGPWAAYALIEQSPLPLVSAHVDLNPQNCLWQGPRLWLVDWEYGSLADPYYDIAALHITHEVPIDRLTSGWQRGGGEALDKARLLAMAAVFAHLCEAWCRHPQAGYLAYAAHYRKAWGHCLAALESVL